jgi:hypothetical protein
MISLDFFGFLGISRDFLGFLGISWDFLGFLGGFLGMMLELVLFVG